MKRIIVNSGAAAGCLCLAMAGCATAPSAPRDVPVIERGTTQEPASGPQGLPPYQLPSGAEDKAEAPRSKAPGSDAAPATPAVVALLDTANRQQQAGQLSAATASLERALHIEPRNPETWYRLAVVRFREGYHGQAEQLARKAEALAGGDNMTRARSWHLIAAAREQAGDLDGARAARQTAEALSGSE